MSTPPPRVSAIVPTIALNDFGHRCLTALLTHEDVEVVLVPDERPEAAERAIGGHLPLPPG